MKTLAAAISPFAPSLFAGAGAKLRALAAKAWKRHSAYSMTLAESRRLPF